jgi:hypothetical protein
MRSSSPVPEDDDRLFVPLASDPHAWFCTGRKTWELRRYGRQYTERQLRAGRRVELRRGYNDAASSRWGVLREVVRAGSLEEFFSRVDFRDVIPIAADVADAVARAAEILSIESGEPVELVGFRVEIMP